MTAVAPCTASVETSTATLRVGLVPYLNAWPVAWGLDGLRDWDTQAMVPSVLAEELAAGRIDLTLGSSIDAIRLDPQPLVLPVSPITSNGASRTVLLASSVDPAKMTRLHCDTDSHTSVALARLLLREQWGVDPEIVPWDARAGAVDGVAVDAPESILMIGDKVVTQQFDAKQWSHTIDLGEAWTELTQLPFVFAVWMLHPDCAHRAASVYAVLDRQQRANKLRFEVMVAQGAKQHRWPVDEARTYLSQNIRYTFGEAQRAGLELFINRCVEHGFVQAGRSLQWADITGR
jgi:chorismate dehydratase